MARVGKGWQQGVDPILVSTGGLALQKGAVRVEILGQQQTPPGRMVLLTISVALLSIFASPGSCQENQTFVYSSNQTAESHSGNGSNHSAMASNTYVYSSNQTAESGSGHGSNHSGMTSNHIGMSQPLELSEHGSNHSGMEQPLELIEAGEQPLELLEDGEQPLELLEDGEQPLELIEDGEVPVEIPDDKCCSEKTVGGIHYKLVGTGETEVYNCLDNCIYHSSSFPRDVWQYCFRPGKQPVECNDAKVTPSAGHHHPTPDPMMEHNVDINIDAEMEHEVDISHETEMEHSVDISLDSEMEHRPVVAARPPPVTLPPMGPMGPMVHP